MYKYYNVHPQGYELPDCVIRAITTATGHDYYDIVRMLYTNGVSLQCETLNVKCYEKLLNYDFGFQHFKVDGYTVEELASIFCDHIIIIRISGHLTVAVFGVIYDLWNCSDESATDFWITY